MSHKLVWVLEWNVSIVFLAGNVIKLVIKNEIWINDLWINGFKFLNHGFVLTIVFYFFWYDTEFKIYLGTIYFYFSIVK